MSQTIPPALRAETIRLPAIPPLLELIDSTNPLLWWRHNEGFIGLGVLHEITTSGEERFNQSHRQWQELCAQADVVNPLGSSGTGLIAFGTFAFRNTSREKSKLIIPEVVVGITSGHSWMTRISWADQDLPALTVDQAQELLERSAPSSARPAHTHFVIPEDAQQQFTAVVNSAVEHITQGELEKVVLARRLEAAIPTGFDIRPALAKLAERYPDCWTFSVDGFFGSSPETLITVQGGSFTARVLAGTAPRGSDTSSDFAQAALLASSAKDLDEHGFATRSVVQSLQPLVQQLSVSESPFTLKLPNVWHLATDIAGTVKDGTTSLELIQALHPTAAVAGTPTDNAVELIDELENFDRGRYAGPVGWVDSTGDGQWALALRCAQLHHGTIEAWAGCGIVAESQPEQEFNETSMKFLPIIEALS